MKQKDIFLVEYIDKESLEKKVVCASSPFVVLAFVDRAGYHSAVTIKRVNYHYAGEDVENT